MKNCQDCWNRINKLPGSDMDSGHMGNRYPICVSLTFQQKWEPCIGGGVILISLRIRGIQPYNISGGATCQI